VETDIKLRLETSHFYARHYENNSFDSHRNDSQETKTQKTIKEHQLCGWTKIQTLTQFLYILNDSFSTQFVMQH